MPATQQWAACHASVLSAGRAGSGHRGSLTVGRQHWPEDAPLQATRPLSAVLSLQTSFSLDRDWLTLHTWIGDRPRLGGVA